MGDSATAHLEMSLENHNLRNYIFNKIYPYIKKDILEVGCGLGAYTELLKDYSNVIPIDINPEYVHKVPGAQWLDISGQWPKRMKNRFDTVVAINVLEHIKFEASAIINMIESLKPDGNIILVLPAYKWLYGHVDSMIGHQRKYTKDMINYNRLKIEKMFYLNSIGIFGWWLTKYMKSDTVNPKSLSIYDKLIPLVKIIDWLSDYSWGLSMVVILKKVE